MQVKRMGHILTHIVKTWLADRLSPFLKARHDWLFKEHRRDVTGKRRTLVSKVLYVKLWIADGQK